jgi:hypothetical protein
LCKLATEADALASTIEQLELGERMLRALAKDYAKLARDVAAFTRQLADAVDRDKKALIREAETEFKELTRREEELASAVNTFCQAP